MIEDLAKLVTETDPRSSFCDPTAGGSDDAYILSTCNMTSPMTWKRGINVSLRIINFNNMAINFNIIDLYTLQMYLNLDIILLMLMLNTRSIGEQLICNLEVAGSIMGRGEISNFSVTFPVVHCLLPMNKKLSTTCGEIGICNCWSGIKKAG